MKKIITISVIALVVSGIYSCSKKDDTSNIVGTYCGALQDNGYSSAIPWLNPPHNGSSANPPVPGISSVKVVVTGIDNQDVMINTYVQTTAGVDSESYTAQVIAVNGSDSLSIPEQSCGGVMSLAGGTYGAPGNSGSYTASTGTLVTSIRIANGCYIDFETFQGTKCTN